MPAHDVTTTRSEANAVLRSMVDAIGQDGTYNRRVAQGHLRLAAALLEDSADVAPLQISHVDSNGLFRISGAYDARDRKSVGVAAIRTTAGVPVGTITIDDGDGTDVVYTFGTEITVVGNTTAQDNIDDIVRDINRLSGTTGANVEAIDMGDGTTIAIVAKTAGVNANLLLSEAETAGFITVTDFQFDADATG